MEYDDDDDGGGDEAAAGAEVKTAVAPAPSSKRSGRLQDGAAGANAAGEEAVEAVETAAAET